MHFILSLFLSALSFSSPVHIPVKLAGNFGEPRPNHFHGGIDVKTNHTVNLGVYSIADGYVSAAIVELHGDGLALIVAHPNGHSSYYLHLNRYAPQIAAAVQRWQYKHHKFAADIRFQPGELPVKRGQLIGLSGNTGASQGPHLHLEIRKTTTSTMIDPLIFLNKTIDDHRPPIIHSFKTYPQPGKGIFERSAESRIFSFNRETFTAWGKVGFAVRADDYMDDVSNTFGVRFMKLYCDGKLVFASDANGIPPADNRMVNSWGDFQHYLNSKVWFLKSFREPGNRLPIIKTGTNQGIIDFNQRRNYRLRYVMSDIYGNQTEKEIIVRAEPTPIPSAPKLKGPMLISPKKDNNLVQLQDVRLEIPGSKLSTETLLHPRSMTINGALSAAYSFSATRSPLLGYGKISLRVNAANIDTRKLYIAATGFPGIYGAAGWFCGGTYKQGWLTTQIRELGDIYYAYYDTRPPLITKLHLDPRNLLLKITDDTSGMQAYEAYIDGRFVLFQQGKDKTIIACNLENTPITPRNTWRTLTVIATDNCNNRSMFKAKVRY